jgi:hypothetical protein
MKAVESASPENALPCGPQAAMLAVDDLPCPVEKVIPAMPMYNQLLKQPFDPSQDPMRIKLPGVETPRLAGC